MVVGSFLFNTSSRSLIQFAMAAVRRSGGQKLLFLLRSLVMRYSSSFTVVAVALAMFAFITPSASATPIDITNWGFETEATGTAGSSGDPTTVNGTTDGAYEFWNVPGWTNGTSLVFGEHNPDTTFYTSGKPSQGEIMLFMDNGSIYQTLGDTLQANTKYTLDVDIGRRIDANGSNASWRVELWAGTTLLDYDEVGIGGIAADTWSTRELTYATGSSVDSGQALKIVLSVPVASGYGQTANFDNVRLDASAIPEPTSFVMTVIGLIGLLCYAWRKRK